MSKTLSPGTIAAVSVPASTSNLGPGFDAFGCAMAIRNQFDLTLMEPGAEDHAVMLGEGAGSIPTDSSNLVFVAARRLLDEVGAGDVSLRLEARLRIPSGRGLGSSSTAIAGGLCAMNAMLAEPLPMAELLRIAVDIEGHPDNVAPALLGGMIVFAAESDPPAWLRLPLHESLSFIFSIPEYEVETRKARRALPKDVTISDAVFNASRTPLLLMALHQGMLHLLPAAMEDRLHQSYRRPLYKGYREIQSAAMEAGARGFCVSGAGPTLLAVCEAATAGPVASGMREAMRQLDVQGVVKDIAPDNDGATVELRQPV